MAAFIASESRRPSFGNLESPAYPLDLIFQDQIEMAELPFVNEHFLLSFDDKTTMPIEQTETFLSNARDVNDATSQQSSADITEMPSEPAAPFISSAVSNQETLSQCSASSLQLSGLDLCVDQSINNNKGKLVSEEVGCASSDLESELYTVGCASGDQLHQEPRINNDLAVPICSIANTPVPEFPAIMGTIEHLSDSSEHNDAQNVAEEAKSPSRSPAYDGDLVSAEQSTLMESLRPGHSASALVNTRSTKRPISKNKHFLEDHATIISSESDSENGQKSARHRNTLKRRKTGKGPNRGSNVIKVLTTSADSATESKPSPRSSRQQGNAIKYNMDYHPIDDFMSPACPPKKAVRCRKKQPESESTSSDIKSEMLRLNEQIVGLLAESRKQQALAEGYVKVLEELVSRLP